MGYLKSVTSFASFISLYSGTGSALNSLSILTYEYAFEPHYTIDRIRSSNHLNNYVIYGATCILTDHYIKLQMTGHNIKHYNSCHL